MRVPVCALVLFSAAGFFPIRSFAGALPMCVAATLSENRQVLVTNEFTTDNPDKTVPAKVVSSVFKVFRQRVDVNVPLRVNGPDTYFGFGPIWKVQFPNDEIAGLVVCPYVLVTNDAEFVVLVLNTPLPRWKDALHIYRRMLHPGTNYGVPLPLPKTDTGKFVRTVPLDELVPKSAIPEVYTDHSPQWYSSGEFSFSEDNTVLFFTGKMTGRVRIDLATGAVTKEENGSDRK